MAVSTGAGTRARRSAEQTREHILSVAADLFYREGVRATGIDTVATRAGVAPPTLYRLFASKDALVAAYVERCSTAYQLRVTVASAAPGPARERILAVFDAFTEEALSDSCRGCPFLLVLAEYPDPDSDAHIRAVAHKAWLRALFHGLARDLAHEAAVSDPDGLGEQLTLVAEGIYGSVQALGSTGPARHGRTCAAALLDAACAAR